MKTVNAGQPVLAVNVHAIGAAHALPARAAIRQAVIDHSLNAYQAIQHQTILMFGLYMKILHARTRILIRIKTIDLEISG